MLIAVYPFYDIQDTPQSKYYREVDLGITALLKVFAQWLKEPMRVYTLWPCYTAYQFKAVDLVFFRVTENLEYHYHIYLTNYWVTHPRYDTIHSGWCDKGNKLIWARTNPVGIELSNVKHELDHAFGLISDSE